MGGEGGGCGWEQGGEQGDSQQLLLAVEFGLFLSTKKDMIKAPRYPNN